MIYEILTQRVELEKRDEYVKVFGDVLKRPTTPVRTASSSSPVSKTRARSLS